MKILMLADVFFPDTIGGAGRMAYYLSMGLCARGHEIHVLTRAKEQSNLPVYEKWNHSLHVHRFRVPARESIALFFSELFHSRKLARQLCRCIDFDLICTHQVLVSLGPLSLPSLASKPLLHWFYSPWHEEFFIKKQGDLKKPDFKTKGIVTFLRWLEKKHLSKANRVIVLSRYSQKQVMEIHGFPEERIQWIPGCVDLNRFQLPKHGKQTLKAELGFPLDRTIFLTIRNIVPRMGLENLIQSYLKSEVLRNNSLLLIGGKGFLEASLQGMVARYGLSDCIRFLGYVPEEKLPNYYQAVDFFILPTKKLEGFGLVILEAMACGTPVLGTPIGAIPEVLAPFDCRLLMEDRGKEAIQKKLEEIIRRPDQYRFDPQVCRDFVQNHYGWAPMLAAFEKLAMETLKQGNA